MLMMFYLVCAVIGGTIFVCQFVMALIGFGGEGLDFDGDIPDDMVDNLGDSPGSAVDHGSSWLFGVLSFRTIVAAITFFGLAGIASLQFGVQEIGSLVIGLLAGTAALYGVHGLMRTFYRLGQDGTVQLAQAVGQRCTVYVPIPPKDDGQGKIQIRLQNRIVELLAMTEHSEKLPTGAKVEILRFVSPTTVEVRPVHASSQRPGEESAEKTDETIA